MGNGAQAIHDGAFVWAGGNNIIFHSFIANRAQFYAVNGFSIDYFSQRPDGGGDKWVLLGAETQSAGRCIDTYTGGYLSSSGVWQSASDRNRKTGFTAVNPRAVLDQLAALPVRQWHYTNETASVKHLGPTAQDFQAAFGLGTDDQSIGMVDADGVALAAIQGLNEKVEVRSQRSEDRIQKLETENVELKKELANLKGLVEKLGQPRKEY
jgi:hypothetical protein